MKIKETTMQYKCGHTRRVLYPRGASKTEVKNAQAWNMTRNCPLCESEKEQQAV